MVFDREGGFEITGRLTLGAGIPRLKSGHLEATLKKEGEAYIVSGKGDAELDIPGIATALTAEYRDGLFKAEVTAGYERGIAKGTATVGATNMPVDEKNGTPAGEPGERLSVYGQGSVTIRFTPWLQGTAGIKVAPDGQIEVRGRIELPASVEVFPEKKIEKELLSIGVDLPIVGVAVAGQRIGIFLNIGGSLTAQRLDRPRYPSGCRGRGRLQPGGRGLGQGHRHRALRRAGRGRAAPRDPRLARRRHPDRLGRRPGSRSAASSASRARPRPAPPSSGRPRPGSRWRPTSRCSPTRSSPST